MKFYILILVFLFASTLVSGFDLNFDFVKDSYSPGDSLQVDITVNGELQSEILAQNVELDCGGDINIAPFLLRISDNHYYCYFDIPLGFSDRNCTLFIRDLIYIQNGYLEQNDFSESFLLNNSNSSFYVNPAAIRILSLGESNTFIIQLINNGVNQTNYSFSTLQSFFDFSKDSLLLNSGQQGQVYVYTSDVLYNNEGKGEIKIDYNDNSFSIPVFFLIDDEDNTNQTVGESRLEFVMDVSNFNISINKANSTYGFVKFRNYGEDTSNLVFELTGNLNDVSYLQFENLDEIKRDETLKQYIYINSNKTSDTGNYSGNLKINYNNKFIEFPIYVEIKDSEVYVNNSVINNTVQNNTNKPDDKNNKISVWFFVGAFFVILLLIFFLLYKKRTKKPTSFLKVFV